MTYVITFRASTLNIASVTKLRFNITPNGEGGFGSLNSTSGLNWSTEALTGMGVSLVGLVGGVLGFFMTPVNFIVGGIVAILTAGTFGQLILLTGIGVLMSITGIVGAVVSGGHPRAGGLMMLLSGVVPLAVGTAMMASVGAWVAILVLYALYFWTFILILGGLMALSKARNSPTPSPLDTAPRAQ